MMIVKIILYLTIFVINFIYRLFSTDVDIPQIKNSFVLIDYEDRQQDTKP